jgi:hypothetical protein
MLKKLETLNMELVNAQRKNGAQPVLLIRKPPLARREHRHP